MATTVVQLKDGTELELKGDLTPDQARAKVQEFRASGRLPAEPSGTSRRFALGETGISAQRSYLERAIGAAPEFAGQAIGGTIGMLAGAIPGGIAGGTIGGGGGRALKSLLAETGIAPRIFGEPPATSAEASEKIGRAGLFGGATEAIAGPIARLLPKAFLRKLTTQQARDISILERERIPYSAGDVRPSQAAQQLENLMKGTLLGAKRASQFEQTQRGLVANFQSAVLNRIGPLLSKEETGEVLQAAVSGRHRQLIQPGGIFDRAYRRLNTIFPAPINTGAIRKAVAPIQAELSKLTAEGRIGAVAKSKEAPTRFIELVDRLAKYGTVEVPAAAPSSILGPTGAPAIAATAVTRREIPLTYADVWKDKQALDGVIRSMSADDPLRTQAKGLLNRLHGILDDAMEQAAQKVSPQAAQRVRGVNKAYGEMKRLYEIDSPVAKIADMDAERIVQRFFAPGSTSAPKELMRAINNNPTVLPTVRRRVVENIFEHATKEIEGQQVVSAALLKTGLAKSKDTLRTILTANQLGGIQEFVDAAARAQASGRMINPASGRQLLAYSQFGSLIQMVGGGVLIGGGNIAAGATAIFGPEVLSRALLNPAIARLLAKGFEIPPRLANVTSWTPRALNALRAVQEEGKREQGE